MRILQNVQDATADAFSTAPAWSGVFAVAFTVACILTAELLPVSLLTPMARELGVSEGAAGQAVTAIAFVALFASLSITALTRGVDRHVVLMSFSALLAVSSLITALAPGFLVLLVGRLLLGVALGGFWAMSASIAMRLVPEGDVPKALSIVFGGVSVAMVIAAPLGSFLGTGIGWRGVFLGAAALGACCWAWQAGVLPSMPARGRTRTAGAWAVARRRGVGAAMLAIFCAFAGQFAFFTYMRPFYETVSGFDVGALSTALLLFGIANFLGTSLSGPVLKAGLKATLVLAPLAMAVCAAGLAVFGTSAPVAMALTASWGFVFGAVPVGWSTWVTRNLADDAENAGGLQVAVIQLANTVGAAAGGYVFEAGGATAPVVAAGLLLLLTALVVAVGVRSHPAES